MNIIPDTYKLNYQADQCIFFLNTNKQRIPEVTYFQLAGKTALFCHKGSINSWAWPYHLAQWDLNYLVSYRKSCWSIALIVYVDRHIDW